MRWSTKASRAHSVIGPNLCMIIDQHILDELSAQAKAPRLRMNYDLRDTSDDESQRMLNRRTKQAQWQSRF